jgi:hypothetical protein
VLLFLNQSPHFQRQTGAKIPRTRDTKPSNEFPQPIPNESYIFGANSGKLKPAMVLKNAAAPVALAAYVVYASIMYAWQH